MTPPTITVGMPVFNGERYLRQAIESVLGQTYKDFELIIRDNASSDGTETICRELASRDGHIRYLRNSTNEGAGPNFNRLVPLAQGRYFMWMAHDDQLAPTFLARCLETLEQDEGAVLAFPRVRFMDANGLLMEEYITPYRTADDNRAIRFSQLTQGGHRCFESFALTRIDRLRTTRLVGTYYNGDTVLLANLALLGKFAEVPETLFYQRRHEHSSMYKFNATGPSARPDVEGYAAWFDPRNKNKASFSYSRAAADYVRMLFRTPMAMGERYECGLVLIDWFRRNWRGVAGEWKRTAFRLLGIRYKKKQSIAP